MVLIIHLQSAHSTVVVGAATLSLFVMDRDVEAVHRGRQ